MEVLFWIYLKNDGSCHSVVWVEDSKSKGSNTNDLLIYYSGIYRQDNKQTNKH